MRQTTIIQTYITFLDELYYIYDKDPSLIDKEIILKKRSLVWNDCVDFLGSSDIPNCLPLNVIKIL